MSILNKARIHALDNNGEILEDVDVYTSGDAVTMDNNRTLEDIYTNDIGTSSTLTTTSKKIVGAINEVVSQQSQIMQPVYKKIFTYSADWSGVKDDGTDTWYYNIDSIKAKIDTLVTQHVPGITLITQFCYINSVYKLSLPTSMIASIITYADSVGCPVKFLKIHENGAIVTQMVSDTVNVEAAWDGFVDALITVANGTSVETITVMNETTIYTNATYDTFVVGLINTVKTAGFDSGVTCGGPGLASSMTANVANACSYIYFNFYPFLTWKGIDSTYNEIKESMYHALLIKINYYYTLFNKEMYVTESGVMEFWENFIKPEDFTMRTGTNSAGLTQTWYQSAMLESVTQIPHVIGYNSWYSFFDSIKPILQKHIIGGGNYEL